MHPLAPLTRCYKRCAKVIQNTVHEAQPDSAVLLISLISFIEFEMSAANRSKFLDHGMSRRVGVERLCEHSRGLSGQLVWSAILDYRSPGAQADCQCQAKLIQCQAKLILPRIPVSPALSRR